MKEGRIALAAVLGSPIAHSKSPILHGYWLKHYGISGFYLPIDVSSDNLRQVLEVMPKMGFVGANVTIPHKVQVLSFAETITDRAMEIGAANTVTFDATGKMHADNTDGEGFVKNICYNVPNWVPQKGPALVLGAGGAARAIVSGLLHQRVPEIFICNRTRKKAEKIAIDFGEKIRVIDWRDSSNFLAEANILINTTSLGMIGRPALPIDLKYLTAKTLVSDIVYNPIQTDLLKQAKQKGCVTVDGLGMLIYQAVPGFTKWFGEEPKVDAAIREVLLK